MRWTATMGLRSGLSMAHGHVEIMVSHAAAVTMSASGKNRWTARRRRLGDVSDQ